MTEPNTKTENTPIRLVLLLAAMFAILASAAAAQNLQLPDDYYTRPQANTAPMPPQTAPAIEAPINPKPSVIVSPVPYNSNFGQPPLRPLPAPQPMAKPVQGSAIDETSISGGIGEDDALRNNPAIAAGHNLKLVFTGVGGIYLADVNYVLRASDGRVVAQGTTYGPILLLAVPAGTYQLEATAEGITKKQSVRAGSKGLQVYQLSYPIT